MRLANMRIGKKKDDKSGHHLLITWTRRSNASRKLMQDFEAPVLFQSIMTGLFFNKTSLRKKHVRKVV